MIVITGATGHFGRIVINQLLSKGISSYKITAFVRDTEKAEDFKQKGISLKEGNYDDYTSMVQAFDEADILLLISGNDVINRQKQQINAVNAAIEADVKHILYTSFARKNETESSPLAKVNTAHLKTEDAIINSGIKYTIMRNSLYADNIPEFVGPNVFETGIYLPAGDGKCAFVTRQDMAEATANILVDGEIESRIYEFSNIENISFDDIAGMLTDISGKQITYTNMDTDEFVNKMQSVGIPEGALNGIIPFIEAIREGEFEADKSDLPTLLGRNPESVKEYLISVCKDK